MLAGCVESVEGANEWNLEGRANSVEADFQELGATGINQYVSRGNIHLYPGGRIPTDRLMSTLDNS